MSDSSGPARGRSRGDGLVRLDADGEATAPRAGLQVREQPLRRGVGRARAAEEHIVREVELLEAGVVLERLVR